MPDPITPDDLYGPSSTPVPEGQPVPQVDVAPAPAPAPAIPVEETPEIINVSPPKPKGSVLSSIGLLILFIGLFVLGVWLSSYIRQYFPGGLVGLTPQQQQVATAPAATPTPTDPMASWKTYQVLNSTTKLAITGISFRLPADVLAPTCDTTTCMSQGTYLPGGTRFTIAPRGSGQLLADFRGSAISDVGGVVFTATDTTIAGHTAKLFTGSFNGKTAGGYGFSQMRGYMIAVSPSLSLEINHFVPNGVTADFAKDDALFDQIVGTLVFPTTSVIPVATSTPVPATTSGY